MRTTYRPRHNRGAGGQALTWAAVPTEEGRRLTNGRVRDRVSSRRTRAARLIKALVDRVVGAMALVAVAPFLLALAVAIRATSPGPPFYRHTRIGRDGRPFLLYKLRTMYRDADRMRDALAAYNECGDGPLFKMRRDPRITPFGVWLRRFSLDELPQLINVVRGEMSLVGPRPLLPSEAARYGDQLWRRLRVAPGITGLWQIRGRSDLSWRDTVRLDLYYVDNWSLRLDLSILGKTIPVVLKGTGAYLFLWLNRLARGGGGCPRPLGRWLEPG